MFGPVGRFGNGDKFVEAIFKNFKYVFHYHDKDNAFFEPQFASTLGKLHRSLKTVYAAFDAKTKFKEMNGRIFHTFLTTAVTGFQANSANTPHKLAVSLLYCSPFNDFLTKCNHFLIVTVCFCHTLKTFKVCLFDTIYV